MPARFLGLTPGIVAAGEVEMEFGKLIVQAQRRAVVFEGDIGFAGRLGRNPVRIGVLPSARFRPSQPGAMQRRQRGKIPPIDRNGAKERLRPGARGRLADVFQVGPDGEVYGASEPRRSGGKLIAP